VEDALTNAFLRLYFEEDVSSDEEEDPVYPESSPGNCLLLMTITEKE
jgi:hypothetical protein